MTTRLQAMRASSEHYKECDVPVCDTGAPEQLALCLDALEKVRELRDRWKDTAFGYWLTEILAPLEEPKP